MILELDSIKELPAETIEKLKAINFFDDGTLQRNLRVLLGWGRK